MDSRTPPLEKTHPTNLPTGAGPSSDSRHSPTPQGGKVLELGKSFIRTLGHFWPDLNPWIDQLPDTRFQEMIVYDKRFLTWWGLLLFCLKLGSRRALDYQLRDTELAVLDNVDQLAKTQQDSLPVHKTLDHFLGHVGSPALADLRNQCVRQLIRNKVLDRFRLEGQFVIAIDGTASFPLSIAMASVVWRTATDPESIVCIRCWRPKSSIKAAWLCRLEPSLSKTRCPKSQDRSIHFSRLPSRQTRLRAQRLTAPGPQIEKCFPANSLLSGHRFIDGLPTGFDDLPGI